LFMHLQKEECTPQTATTGLGGEAQQAEAQEVKVREADKEAELHGALSDEKAFPQYRLRVLPAEGTVGPARPAGVEASSDEAKAEVGNDMAGQEVVMIRRLNRGIRSAAEVDFLRIY